jgi:hypothetical protein
LGFFVLYSLADENQTIPYGDLQQELCRASQFSCYLLETAGSFDQDTNARASAVKLNKNSYSRAFVALLN